MYEGDFILTDITDPYLQIGWKNSWKRFLLWDRLDAIQGQEEDEIGDLEPVSEWQEYRSGNVCRDVNTTGLEIDFAKTVLIHAITMSANH